MTATDALLMTDVASARSGAGRQDTGPAGDSSFRRRQRLLVPRATGARLPAGAVAVLGAVLSTALLAVLPGVPAAGAAHDGTWWYSGMGVAEAHAQGATGAGVTVAVIDDGIAPDAPFLSDADLLVREPSFCFDGESAPVPAARPVEQSAWHGTTVTGFVVGNGRGADGGPSIAGVAPDARVLFYAVSDGWVDPDGSSGYTCAASYLDGAVQASEMAQALRQAVDDGAQIITISLGTGYVYNDQVLDALAWALHEGVIVTVALGEYQDGSLLPLADDLAQVNGTVAVEACDVNREPMEGSPGSGAPMPHDRVTVCAPGVGLLVQSEAEFGVTGYGRGTSFAAPITAGALAAVWSAYPSATSNQILQSLVHNTGAEDHELVYDPVHGYGLLGLRHMLREDPTAFPDENPLLVDVGENPGGRWGNLSLRDVADATRPVWPGDPDVPADTAVSEPAAASATPVAGSGSQGADVDDGVTWLWPVVGGAGAVLVAGVAGVVLAQRRRHAAGTFTPPAAGSDR